MLIYHIVLPEVWEKFENDYEYESESLASEGFIHCSYRNQLDEVLARYYKNADKVLILHIESPLFDGKIYRRTFDQQGDLPAYLREDQ